MSVFFYANTKAKKFLGNKCDKNEVKCSLKNHKTSWLQVLKKLA